MQKITQREMLCYTMYKMFKNNYLEYIEIKDFIVMWQALADYWNIECSDWNLFTYEVNSHASNRQSIFNKIFDNYFK